MVLQEVKPSAILADIVRTIRVITCDLIGQDVLPVKAYPPRPEHCLSFYVRDVEHVTYQGSGARCGGLRVVVFGQPTEVTHRMIGSNFLLIQVVFMPGGLYRLTGIPSHQLTNQYIDAAAIFSNEISLVSERLAECNLLHEMITMVEKFLFNEWKRSRIDTHAADVVTAALFGSDAIPNVDGLAHLACLSPRNLERYFQLRMGVSPKYLLKVMRFENAFRMKNKDPMRDWLSIALHCGYYDYQHLARDYRSLTGHSPVAFHELDAKAPERLFGEADTY